MAHPQNSFRGLWTKQKITISDTSSNTVSLTANANGLLLDGAVSVSSQATYGKLSANSTALILPNSVRIGTKTSYLSSNSTGILLGTRYLSTNTTGNSAT